MSWPPVILRIITPLFFVLPGIAAIKLYPHLEKPDQAYLVLVKSLIPTGLKGLVLAGMAAALMATVSTVLNATSTMLTIDLYKKARPAAGDREQVVVGMISGVVVLIISVLIAFIYITQKDSLFVLIQTVFFYIAPPFAVVFLLGLIWPRANGTAAVVTIISGFLFLLLLQKGVPLAGIPPLWDSIPWLTPYKKAYQHTALLTWIFSMTVMIITSLAHVATAAGASRRNYLEPQLPLAATRGEAEIQRLERFPHLVAAVRPFRALDLWLLRVVQLFPRDEK